MNQKAEIRLLQLEDDYLVIAEWFSQRNRPIPRKDRLPLSGLMGLYSGKAVGAGFLFSGGLKMGTISGLISDPASSSKIRGLVIEEIIGGLIAMAKTLGLELISAGTNLPRLASRYKRLGFVEYDKNVTIFGREI